MAGGGRERQALRAWSVNPSLLDRSPSRLLLTAYAVPQGDVHRSCPLLCSLLPLVVCSIVVHASWSFGKGDEEREIRGREDTEWGRLLRGRFANIA